MINLCLWGAPGHVYKGWREEEAGPHRVRPKRGVLLGLPSPGRIPPPTWNRKKGRKKEKEGKGRPISLVQFGPAMGGAQPPLEALLSFPLKPIKAHYFPGGVR